jgi:uncharacterized RDD family membrane protein YckC
MMETRTNKLTIRTPEGIEFSLSLAGPVTRFLARAIDFGIEIIAIIAIGYLISMLDIFPLIFGVNLSDWAFALLMIGYFVVPIIHSMLFEWLLRGQTLGKRVLRLRVVDADGLRLQVSQVVIRNLLRFVDSLYPFYVIGGIACLLSRRSQRLGDYVANTVVMRLPKIVEPDLTQVLSGKYNSFRDYPHLEARLRQRVSPEEARIALHAVLRRDGLEPQARVELFADIADHFRSLVAFPEEATLGVADEQYVRNVVDVLFRPQGPREVASAEARADSGLRQANPVQ